jgi:hypothetical protein
MFIWSIFAVKSNRENSMSNYTRTTRECSVTQIHPELLRAIRAYFQSHNLGEVEAENLLCCETVSEKKPDNWLTALDPDADSTLHMALLVTPQILIWARRSERHPAQVHAADLIYLRAKPFVSILTRESGLEISGPMDDSRVYMRGQLSLGPEPAAEKFCEAVQQAIEKINPKSNRKWPTWLGGGQ